MPQEWLSQKEFNLLKGLDLVFFVVFGVLPVTSSGYVEGLRKGQDEKRLEFPSCCLSLLTVWKPQSRCGKEIETNLLPSTPECLQG